MNQTLSKSLNICQKKRRHISCGLFCFPKPTRICCCDITAFGDELYVNNRKTKKIEVWIWRQSKFVFLRIWTLEKHLMYPVSLLRGPRFSLFVADDESLYLFNCSGKLLYQFPLFWSCAAGEFPEFVFDGSMLHVIEEEFISCFPITAESFSTASHSSWTSFTSKDDIYCSQ